MIKYLMRKTLYKDFDLETQDILLQLISKQHLIELLCCIFVFVILISTFIPLLIIDLCENVEFALTTQIAIIVFEVSYATVMFLLLKFFPKAVIEFLLLLSEQVYFLIYTTKGNALSKTDFEFIKNKNEDLYNSISSQGCRGYCYAICFDILKVLEKGTIEFVAVKRFTPFHSHVDEKQNFTMHVLYINNGWAFDTYSQRQYPIEKLHKIYKAKIYRSFTFDEINNMSYDEFRKTFSPDLANWCNANDCLQFWNRKVI